MIVKLSSRMQDAVKKGWKIVKIDNIRLSGFQWFQIIKWCENNSTGKFVSSFISHSIAFENEKDYLIFLLKWK